MPGFMGFDKNRAAEAIATALGDATREGRGWRCRCPIHGGVSLNVADGSDGRLLVHCWVGCDPLAVLAELRGLGLSGGRSGDQQQVGRPRPTVHLTDTPSTEGYARAIWGETVSASGTVVEAYLTGRGLALPPRHDETLRFHPACAFKGECIPAMVALFRDVVTDEPCGVHRTALLPDGSDRDRKRGKAMLGRTRGAAIKLCPDDEVTMGLGLAEGVETGLRLMALGWRPIWAAGSTSGMAPFPPLPGINELTIFADADSNGAGLKAARECGRRWFDAGRRATIRMPRVVGADWGDAA